MSRCNFCGRVFQNAQAVKAHLRRCPQYQHSKDSVATRLPPTQPLLNPQKHVFHNSLTPNETAKSADPFAALLAQITQQFAGPDETTRIKQRREACLASLYSSLIDGYRPPEGVVTADMAVTAKVAILDELATLPIDELPQAELILRGTAIRNRVFAPYFKRQQAQRHRQSERQYQNDLRRQQATDARTRRTTRKCVLVELGVTRALTLASSRGLPARALPLLEWEVRGRLNALLVGDETEQQVNETIEASIERPLIDWAARIEQVQNARRDRLLNQCLTLATPVASAAWPWLKDTLVKQWCERFGIQPSPRSESHTNGEDAAPERPSSPTNSEESTQRPVRRRGVRPSGPTLNPDEMAGTSESVEPTSPERKRAAS